MRLEDMSFYDYLLAECEYREKQRKGADRMKLIIDIPKEIYKASQIIGGKFDDVIQIPLEVIANCTPIPDNATNGDVIKAMFPNIVVEEQSKDLFIVFNMDFQGTPFYKTWWNARYMKGE